MNPLKFETNDIVRLKEGAKYKVYNNRNGSPKSVKMARVWREVVKNE